jgi:hypothetical protein
MGRPAHSMHLSRLRSVGISINSGQPETSMMTSRPHWHVTSIDRTPRARMLAMVIAGPVYGIRIIEI